MGKRRIWMGLVCLALFGLLAFSGCGGYKSNVATEEITESKEPDSAPEVFQGGSLKLSIDYGYDKYVKSGRYMRVIADITNSGENFSGNLSVIVPGQNQKQYKYEKEVSLAGGETKRLELAVPVGGVSNQCNFVLTDANERVVAEKSVKAYVSRDNDLFTGILTDDTQGMAYLSGNQMKTFYLDADNFPEDALGLDSLDILIINDFNTEALNEKQYGALKEFVMQGGTLVLGTGSTGVKTMAAFKDSFLTGAIGDLTKRATAFGLTEEKLVEIKNQLLEEALARQEEKEREAEAEDSKEGEAAEVTETVAEENTASKIAQDLLPETDAINQLSVDTIEKDILSVHLDGATVLVKENDVALLESLSKGKGKVLLFTMDLGLDSSLRDTIGREIANQIAGNISISGAEKINRESYGYNYSYLQHSAADLVDAENVPSVGKYAVILLVYVLLIGPPLYFVLKKLDKRQLTWAVIPLFSVLFGSFIYGIGGATRQDAPYIRFVAIKTIENGMAATETLFGITAPYNDNYELQFMGSQHVVPEITPNDYYSGNLSSDNDYNIAVKYGGGNTEIKIKDYPAFETTYFKTSSSEEEEGSLGSTLDFTDFIMKGEVTNNLGYKLEQAALYAYGVVYPLGDLEQGQTISLTGRDGYLILNRNDIYNHEELITELSGGKPYGSQKEQTAEQVRWYYTYEYYLTKLVGSDSTGCYLMGFSEDTQNAFLEGSGLDVKGVNMAVATVDVNLSQNGLTYIPRLDAYIQNVDGNYDRLERFLYGEECYMELQFNSNEKIQEIIYSGKMNQGFGNHSTPSYFSFAGEVKAYNYMTNEYELLFKSGEEGSVPAAAYLDENNRMKLWIIPDETVISNQGQVSMPVLSAVKGEK